ncbi:MAG: hypothetical protein EPN91_03275 [Salinibacterium sp.]|nr:MAG: hypothetical protein EPN91_03275 [Salinibacterium sp.]
MSDDLTISGGGSFAVATDDLFSRSQLLHRISNEAASIRALLAMVDHFVSRQDLVNASAPACAFIAESEIAKARFLLGEIEVNARGCGLALTTAAEAYGFVEHMVGRMGVSLSGQLGGLLGQLFPGILGTKAASWLGGHLGGVLPRPSGDAGNEVGQAVQQHNDLITNPFLTTVLRDITMSSDEFTLGSKGVPASLASLAGATGLVGVPLGAGAVQYFRKSIGAFKETPVVATSIESRPISAAPGGYVDRLSRVPHPESDGGAQVVVEKYATPGEPDRFGVFIGGTADFSPAAGAEPWDMTSNVANAAGEQGGSYRAVVEAMKLAGVQPDSPVQFTGYSQGGGVAAMLSASGHYNTQGLATFGAPTGQVAIPEAVPAVLVEHTDDIVPAFGGTQDNQHALIVERQAFGGEAVPTDIAVPAHNIHSYERTAQLMDAASSEQIRDARATLDNFGSGATTVTSTAYRFERVHPASAT